jgi:hypothetical protein
VGADAQLITQSAGNDMLVFFLSLCLEHSSAAQQQQAAGFDRLLAIFLQ